MLSAEDFDKFAQTLTPSQPEPAAAAATAAPEPEAAAAAATETPEAVPAVAENTEPVRDDKGRFVKVAVHAREVSQRDARIRDLEAKLSEAQAKVTAAPTPTPRNIEVLEKLKESMPDEAADVLFAEFSARDLKLDKALATLERYERQEAERAEATARTQRDEVDAAIEADEHLSAWKAAVFDDAGKVRTDADPEAIERWDAAARHDELLQRMPAWVAKPMAERIQEAKRRAAADLGIALPSTTSPQNPQRALPTAGKPAVPASLSNIPAGKTPVTTTPNVLTMDRQALREYTRGKSQADIHRLFFGT